APLGPLDAFSQIGHGAVDGLGRLLSGFSCLAKPMRTYPMPFSSTFNRALGALSLCALLAAPASALSLGEQAPSFSATTLSGQPVALAEVIGKRPVYLKFWATWCRYCVYELPHAQSLYDAYGD